MSSDGRDGLLPQELTTGGLPGPIVPPVPIHWSTFVLLVLTGLFLSVASAWAASHTERARPVEREAPVDRALLDLAVQAYEEGDWGEAVETFEKILSAVPGHARSLDYLERIELTLEDAERLRRAEEALVAGKPLDAERLAVSVAPNSPLFAQAESVARTAREQRAPAEQHPHDGAEKAPVLDVTAALVEAVALYEAGRFADAALRATELAEGARPELQKDLIRWAHDCRRFAHRFTRLPTASENLVNHVAEVMEAVILDERLSDGHYARKLRTSTASALGALALVLLDGGDLSGGCERAREGAELDDRDGTIAGLLRRCDREADRRVTQARALEVQHPEQALRLYRQAFELSTRGSRAHRSAQRGLDALSWSSGE
jgi:tetratricopeptide (TPR) repeat protein